MSNFIALRPRLSEKSHEQAGRLNVYVFDVPASANKLSVEQAVANQFEVGVAKVNITNLKGKPKRTVRKGSRPVAGKRAGIKKAYVTLKEGAKLPFFEAEEEKAEKQAKMQEKLTKRAEKEAQKAEKEAVKKSKKPSSAKTAESEEK